MGFLSGIFHAIFTLFWLFLLFFLFAIFITWLFFYLLIRKIKKRAKEVLQQHQKSINNGDEIVIDTEEGKKDSK